MTGNKFKDITGWRFGKLLAVERTGFHYQPNGSRKTMWMCKCDCGNNKEVMLSSLSCGYSLSCGKCKSETMEVFDLHSIKGLVIPRESGLGNFRHGLSKERLYKLWVGILKRCYDTQSKGYIYYGSKGISVCTRWLNVTNFIEDNRELHLGELSIDRIDTDGDYSPENCRWVPLSDQSKNTSPKHWGKVKYKGICWCPRREVYRANLYIEGKQTHLGFFDCPIEAALVYDKRAEKEKGELAWLNRNYFPEIRDAYLR